MGVVRRARPVKLLVGMLAADVDLFQRARQLLSKRYGPVDMESDTWPFTHSDYYADEMGPHLQRRFITFETLVQPEHLAATKIATNQLETYIAEQTLSDAPRPINIDPGYLTLDQLVLASTKGVSHRVYLDQGVYAEITLRHIEKKWEILPWTYPDFREPPYHVFFERVRERYREQRQVFLATLAEDVDALRDAPSDPHSGGAAG